MAEPCFTFQMLLSRAYILNLLSCLLSLPFFIFFLKNVKELGLYAMSFIRSLIRLCFEVYTKLTHTYIYLFFNKHALVVLTIKGVLKKLIKCVSYIIINMQTINPANC